MKNLYWILNQVRGRKSFETLALTFALFVFTGGALRAQPYPAEILAQEGRLTNNVSSAYDGFGQSVDISGDRIAVAGDGVTLFKRQANGTWSRELNLSGGQVGEFADHVALEGDTLATSGFSYGELNYGPRVLIFKHSSDPALNAWNTTDDSTGSGVYYRYNHPLTANEQTLAATEGWTLTVHARVAGYFDTPSCFVDFTDANEQRFLVFFSLDEQGNLLLEQPNNLGTVALTADGLGWAKYHTHQIVFDTANGTADYYFDGQKMNTAPWPKVDGAGLDGVRFGNGSTSGSGSMNVNRIELKTRQTDQVLALYDAGTTADTNVDLDPEHQGWTRVPDGTDANVSAGPLSPDDATVWQGQAVIFSNAEVSDLALEGDTLVVGMATDYVGGSNRGSAAVYVRSGGAWALQQALNPSVAVTGDYYGQDVAISGDTVIVGAPHINSSSANSYGGRAFVFVRSGTTWTEQQLLEANDKAGQDAFGVGVAVDGDRAVIGAKWDDHSPNSYAGSAYVFERAGTAWTQTAKVFPQSIGSGELDFGSSVALAGNALVVGGYYGGTQWLFTTTGSGWKEVQSKVYPDTVDPALHEVAIDGERFVVGVAGTESETGAVYAFGLDYGNAAGLADYVRKLLYYGDAGDATIPFDPNQTAFRYKDLLYGQENLKIRSRFELMGTLYGDADRSRAAYAESELAKGLLFSPDDPGLQDLMLDIYYDRTVAETVFNKDVLATAQKAHFGGLIGIDSPVNGFEIDQEIPPYQQALDKQRATIDGLLSLLGKDFGVPGNPPLGYQMFRDRVPLRALMSPNYTNDLGELVPVSSEPTLFDGYKDAVLAFDQLRDYGQTAVTVGRLMLARDNPASGGQFSDRDQVRQLIAGALQYLYAHGHLVKDIFPALPPPGDASGLAEAIAGWEGSLTDLEGLQQILAGDSNVLGFAPDFMMFIQNFGTQTTPEFHSYDIFHERLDPVNSSSVLKLAAGDLQAAQDSYLSFKGYEDQLASNFGVSSITYEDRLRDIVGVFPDDPNGNYVEDPTRNPGSELEQQYRSIQAARLKILKNQTEISNVRKQVQIERERVAQASEVYIRYGNQRASIEEKLGEINAAQAGANQLADYFNPENLISGASIAIALNFGVQTTTELMKGQLSAQKERLAGLESAELEGVESQATIKNLLLQLNTLAVDSMESALLLTQEANRLAGLYREKKDLERKLAERDQNLAKRFFADPIHREIMQTNMLRADISFQTAQKWMYFAVRALQYKHNIPFIFDYNQRHYTPETIFKLRNAQELADFYIAMDQFDQLKNLGDPERHDAFSVREDFFGYVKTNRFGQALLYPDPITGQQVSAVAAFRSRLRQLQDAQGTIVVPFSTVRQKPGGFFFQGPSYDVNGNPIPSTGRYLDKIRSIGIRLPGNHTLGQSQISGNLTYGGTSFIRNPQVGTLDPARPDQIINEMTPYSTRVWFFDTTGGLNRWNFKESLKINGVPLDVMPDDGSVPTTGEIVEFKERSVAATGWVLEIPTISVGTLVLDIDELNDIEIHFWHYSASR